jgi:ketosteroid isomerase-like protein
VVRRPAGPQTAAACIAAFGLAGCGWPGDDAPSSTDDLAAIAQFNRQYLAAINDGDIESLSRLTTESHIMIAPDRPPIVGKAANDAANSRVFEQFEIDEIWSPSETALGGDWAYQRGSFSVTATPKGGGEPSTTTGSFLRIYARQPDGSWRMTIDMFNRDSPPSR